MTGNTQFWDVDGVSLTSFASDIETLTGRGGIPTFRGEDIPVAYRPGNQWKAKVPDFRKLSLAMWVLGVDSDGFVPSADQAKKAQFNENWRQLKRMFFVEDRQIVLTRRQETLSGLLVTSALAEVAGAMEPTMFASNGGKFIVDLMLADPYFYGTLIPATPINVGASSTIHNRGDATVRKMRIQLSGPVVNPVLTNTSFDTAISVGYVGTIPAGHFVLLDTDLFTAFDDTSVNQIANVTHVGDHFWMKLMRDDNHMTFTADSGTGNAAIDYKPAYL